MSSTTQMKSSASNKITFSTFDPSKVIFKDVMKMKNGNPIMYLGYGVPSKRCVVVSPYLRTPFGPSCYNLENLPRESIKYNLPLTLSRDDPEQLEFCEKVRQLEERLKEHFDTHVNKKKGKKQYLVLKSVLSQDDEEKYDPLLKTKLSNVWGKVGEMDVKVFNEERERLNMNVDNAREVVPPNSHVSVGLFVASVWMMPGSNQYGLTLQTKQMMVKANENDMDECVFGDEATPKATEKSEEVATETSTEEKPEEVADDEESDTGSDLDEED